MRLREKGKKDGEIVTLGWDEAQAALQAGTHVVADDDAGSGEKIEAGNVSDETLAEKPDAKAPRSSR